MPAGADFVYPLVAGGIYHFNCNGTKIDFIGGASQVMPYGFHDDVTMAADLKCMNVLGKNDGDTGMVFDGAEYHSGTNNQIEWVTAGQVEMALTNAGTLHVDADVICYSSTVSDIRLKKNIKPISSSLATICKLDGVKFDWIHRDEKENIGLIAQQVEEHIPEAIKEQKLMFYSNNDGKDYKTINYDMIVPHLIESIKELKLELDDLKNQLKSK